MAVRESRDWSVEMPTWLRRSAPSVEICFEIAGTPGIAAELLSPEIKDENRIPGADREQIKLLAPPTLL